jgi:hypothetical protein
MNAKDMAPQLVDITFEKNAINHVLINGIYVVCEARLSKKVENRALLPCKLDGFFTASMYPSKCDQQRFNTT